MDLGHADRSHLLLCGVARQAVRAAQLDLQELKQRRVGVYVAYSEGDCSAGDTAVHSSADFLGAYLDEMLATKLAAHDRARLVNRFVQNVRLRFRSATSQTGHGNSPQFAAGIITKSLELRGPSMVVDTACASSLTGLALAVRAIQLENIDLAIVGASSCFRFDRMLLLARAQVLSKRASEPFSADADGISVGEGYAAVVLKSLSAAIRDRDPICGVIVGMGASSSGRGRGGWKPLAEAQVRAIKPAYSETITPDSIQFIEAHATSTPLGDSTELTALHEALYTQSSPRAAVPIASSKGNIGHTLEAAGLAGLIKIVLALQHKIIPPSVCHSQALNPKVDWPNVPFFVPRDPIPWQAPAGGLPRRAALSAIGAGGANVHVVIEEFAAGEKGRSTDLYGMSAIHSSDTAPSARSKEARLVISGVGAKLSAGSGLQAKPNEIWELMLDGRGYDACYWPAPGATQQTTTFDWKHYRVPPKDLAGVNPLTLLLLEAVEDALKSANLAGPDLDRNRVGVVVGTLFQSSFLAQWQLAARLPFLDELLIRAVTETDLAPEIAARLACEYQDVLKRNLPALVDESCSYSGSTMASKLWRTFDLRGEAVCLDAGGATGNEALSAAIDLLSTGDCDTVVCACAHPALNVSDVPRSWYVESGWPAPVNVLTTETEYAESAMAAAAMVLKRTDVAQQIDNQWSGLLQRVRPAGTSPTNIPIRRTALASL